MSVDEPSARIPTVVVVEDDVALLQALRFMLISEGFQTLACETGEALLGLQLPDDGLCLVIDQRLPGMSGLQTLRVLRDRGLDSPALVITTDPDDKMRAEALAAGAQIVEKPLVGDALLEAVKASLAARERT